MFGHDKDKPKKTSGLRELAGVLGGAAHPQRLEDHKGMLPGKAKIVADEGYHMAENSAKVALQHQKYIVDVTPDNGDPAFRAEVDCWVSWPDFPSVGNTVAAGYKPGTKDVVLLLAGDKKFDWELRAASKQSGDAATREALLNAPPGSHPPKSND